MVVNKVNTIENEFRNFEMEILAQDSSDPPPDTIVTTCESKIKFKFDFSKVFWNPRLSFERNLIMKKLQNEVDTLYDVFAGVGPFTIAAAKLHRCRSLANDLNPESFKWMCENVKINKVEKLVRCYNVDGRVFIKEHIKNDLIDQIKNFDGSDINRKFHVVMNLPEIAIEFLSEFNGLLSSIKNENYEFQIEYLNIHCYCFLKNISEASNFILQQVSEHLGFQLPMNDVDEIIEVRKVAPSKYMYRISFRLNKDILYGMKTKMDRMHDEQPNTFNNNNNKRLKIPDT